MAPAQWLPFLALLSSSLGTTIDTADDCNHTSKIHYSQYSHGHSNDINLSSHISTSKDKRETIINNTQDHHDTNEMKKSTYLKFMDFVVPEHNPKLEIKEYSSLNNPKYINGRRFWSVDHKEEALKRVIRSERNKTKDQIEACENFKMTSNNELYSPGWPDNYKKNLDCNTTISPPGDDKEYIIIMDFRDFFHIEDHSECSYDFLEVRDGSHGYDNLVKFCCGKDFPTRVQSTGPNLWIRFKSDSTIVYEGFKAVFTFEKSTNSRQSISECSQDLAKHLSYEVKLSDTDANYKKCKDNSKYGVDAIWNIVVPDTYNVIFLNFTNFTLAFPNECTKNSVEVFGVTTGTSGKLKQYCATIAESFVYEGNTLHVRVVTHADGKDNTSVSFHYTAFRNSAKDQVPCKTDPEEEWDCDDMYCIDKDLKCDGYADCRFKGDEDPENCPLKSVVSTSSETDSPVTILVIFSLIFSGVCLVMIYRCIRKLVVDTKIIKEHLREAREQRLDMVADGAGKKPADPNLFQRDFLKLERESLQRENIKSDTKRQRKKEVYRDPFESDFVTDETLWPVDVEGNAKFPTKDLKVTSDRANTKKVNIKKEKALKHITSKEGPEDRTGLIDNQDNVNQNEIIDSKENEKRQKSQKGPKHVHRTSDGKATRDAKFTDRDRPGTASPKNSSKIKESLEMEEKVNQGMEMVDPEGSRKRKVSICLPDTRETDCQTKESLFHAIKDGHSSNSKKVPEQRQTSTETTRSAPDVIIVFKPNH